MTRPPAVVTRSRLVAVCLAGVVLVASVFVVWRVFAPGEVSAAAKGAYPAAPVARPGVVGTLPSAPLIVDGRLRLFADKRQVRVDGPVDSRVQNTPYWSFRRWPATLVGVVSTGQSVVTRWSDGEVVRLDARTGRATWRVAGPRPTRGYDDRRTRVRAVYEPAGLAIAGESVVVADDTRTLAYAVSDGRPLWQASATPPTCSAQEPAEPRAFSTGDGRVAVARYCDQSLAMLDARTGAETGVLPFDGAAASTVEPLGCASPGAECRGVRVGGPGDVRAWLLDGAGRLPVAPPADPEGVTPEATAPDENAADPAPLLAEPDSWLSGPEVVRIIGAEAVACDARTGAELWRHALDGDGTRILTTQPGRVHLLTVDRDLVTLDAASGAETSRFRYTYFAEKTNWAPGHAYASGGFVATERLRDPVDAAAEDARFFFDAQPVILAAT